MTITLLFQGAYSIPDSCDTPHRVVAIGELACYYELKGEGSKKDKRAVLRFHRNARYLEMCDVDVWGNRWSNLLTGYHDEGTTPQQQHATLLQQAGALLGLL